ncbi:MAG: inorganic diphosphatase [Acidobacteriota bacterium]|jgi:inorganic pyrophosphatase|nr:inorganic diphosphatase [Acidobacteriota bacterium]MDQ3374836.1 inorganic diphosphatase [Acidobacteriota bacterium]
MQKKSKTVFDKLSVFNEAGELNVIVDTPKGSRNKYKFDEDLGLFKLGGVLAVGHTFPFDFGYIPGTLGGDGDPLDVLILMDEPAFVGCLIPSRLIGVIQAKQTEDGKTEVNDRLIAIAANARAHSDVKSLRDLNKTLVDEIEHFFVSYNEAKGKKFEPTGHGGTQRARRIVEEGIKRRK